MNIDNVVYSIKEVLLFSNQDKTKSTTPRLVNIVVWLVICLWFEILGLYLIPLLPLVYYCYRPKKADHLALIEWCRDEIVKQVNITSQLYIQYGHPPHLFLGGLYGYIIWVTLLRVLRVRWIGLILGIAWITRDQWIMIGNHHLPSIQKLVTFLFPPCQSEKRTMVQRALEYQQQYMIQTLDQNTTHYSPSQPLTFTIYENQRRSPLSGTWHSLTLPLERTTWTDDAHATVLPKHEFVLPSPVQLEKEKGHKIVWTWVWVDSDWQHVDWIYGNWIWTKTDLKEGWTRQRKWTRRAILECTCILQEKKQQSLIIDPPPYHTTTTITTTTPTTPITPTPITPTRNHPITPLSPQPSSSSNNNNNNASLYDRRPVDFSSSQVSLLSTKTDDQPLSPSSHSSSYRDPKRSSSSSRSNRRQAVWKSIVKT